ncbi:MAG: allose ABC transporter [Lachnospiraceae bacterium]|nr:allose ABC transporter [Lachnospiraceae bacterium]
MTKAKFKSFWDKFGTLSILVLMLVCLSIASPKYFLTADNFKQIGLQSTVYILLAFGEFFAILLAGIDLSVGSVAALVGMFIAMMLKAGVPIPLAILAGLLIALVFGAVNGILINALDLHPFVVTLGTNTIFRGITLVVSNGSPVYGLPKAFKDMSGYVFGFPIPLLFALIMAVVLILFTTRSVAARNLYALGGNKQSAWYSGINTKHYTLFAHMLASLLAGVAGIIMTSRVGAAEPTAGDGYETFAIASCIIGGTSFFGGKGKIFGVLLGGLTIGTITNGLNILNVSSYYQKIVMGALIIGSVALEKVIGNSVKNS